MERVERPAGHLKKMKTDGQIMNASNSTEAPTTALHSAKIPLSAKLILSSFMLIWFPVYWHNYGPTNFLYFCDAALLLTLAGIWTESALLISMSAVGILVPQFIWLLDFGGNCLGWHLTGMTNYMFNPKIPLFARCLSGFHGWLPLLLVWLLRRVGYDRRALAAWSALGVGLVLVSYGFLPGPGTHPADPNTPVNVDYVYGLSDAIPQHWMNQNLYVAVWAAALVLLVYLPTHAVLRRLYHPARPVA